MKRPHTYKQNRSCNNCVYYCKHDCEMQPGGGKSRNTRARAIKCRYFVTAWDYARRYYDFVLTPTEQQFIDAMSSIFLKIDEPNEMNHENRHY